MCFKRPEEGTIFLVKARRNNLSGVSYSEALPHLVVTTGVPFRHQIQLASPEEYCTGKSPQVCPSLPASPWLKSMKASNPKSINTAPTISDVWVCESLHPRIFHPGPFPMGGCMEWGWGPHLARGHNAPALLIHPPLRRPGVEASGSCVFSCSAPSPCPHPLQSTVGKHGHLTPPDSHSKAASPIKSGGSHKTSMRRLPQPRSWASVDGQHGLEALTWGLLTGAAHSSASR